MADRWAFIVAIEKHLDPTLGVMPYAEAGAKALADALTLAGYPKAKQVVLLGPHATKTAVESRLRKLKKAVRKGDEVLAYWAGNGFLHNGNSSFMLWDTLPDDLRDTGLSLVDFASALAGTKASQVTLLIDAPADLTQLFEYPDLVALAASDANEPSHHSSALKGSVWTHLLLDAFTGRAVKALDAEGHITTVSLQRFIEDELPRVLRKHFEAGVTQTPQFHGTGNPVLADLAHLLGAADGHFLDPERLKRVVFRSESHGRVKDLTAWRKTFDLPESARPSAKKFVARIANTDVKTDLDEVFDAAREHLGYKRKDVEVIGGPDGFGTVRTPDFEYTVAATLDADDPTKVAWRREVGQFADAGFVRGAGFEAVFGKLFDQLVFEFAAPVDVESLVDRLEDRPPKGAKVQVASDGGSCDITLAGFAGRVTVDRHSLTVRGRGGNSAGLLDQFLAFVQSVGPLGEQAMLPPAH